MRFAMVTLVVLAAAGGDRRGCTDAPAPRDDACVDRACGEPCEYCPPGVPPESCPVPTFAATACNARGECVTEGTFVCSPCDGKGCGDACVIEPPCRDVTPPCMVPSTLGHCDGEGQCVPWDLPYACSPDAACEGKACGETCDACGGLCMHPFATACDLAGRCVPLTQWLCYDPCAGKACGDDCRVCPPDAIDCFETAVLKACDAAGACVPRSPDLSCP